MKQLIKGMDASPSTRRAWIEIDMHNGYNVLNFVVALHPEGVDRNANSDPLSTVMLCRPPPGGRG